MEDAASDESSEGEFAAATSSARLSNAGSDDSQISYASFLCPNDDDPMTTANSSDGWESDAYYNMSETFPDEGSESHLASCSPVFLDLTQNDAGVKIADDAPEIVEILDEALEENNNDPNNNMDSIEMSDAPAPSTSGVSTTNHSVILVDSRSESPKPGCSKDSHPASREPPPEELTLEKTRHILELVSRIHRDSVFDALVRRDGVPIHELKFWDLLPESERLDYPEVMECCEVETRDYSSVEKAVTNGHMQKECAMPNGFKRGPDRDICTVESKKSALDPDLSSIPTTTTTLPRVSSSSQAAGGAAKIVAHRGAVPKAREEPRNRKRQPEEVRTRTRESVDREIETAARSKNLVGNSGDTTTIREEPRNAKRLQEEMRTKTQESVDREVETAARSKNFVVNSGEIPKIRDEPRNAKRQSEEMRTKTRESVDRKIETAARSKNFVVNSGELPKIREEPRNAKRQQEDPSDPRAQMSRMRDLVDRAVEAVGRTTKVVVGSSGEAPKVHVARELEAAGWSAKIAVNRGAIPKVRDERHADRERLAIPRGDQTANNRATGSSAAPELVRQERTNWRSADGKSRETPGNEASRRNEVVVKSPVLKYPTNRTSQPSEAGRPSSAELRHFTLAPSARVAPTAVSLVTTNRQSEREREKPAEAVPGPAQAPHPQNRKRPICMEMYYKLIVIFPNIDPEYVKDLCPPDWGPGDHDAQMEPIVEHLLEHGPTLPQAPAKRTPTPAEPDTTSTDDVYETLLGIFPDADPHYLREFAVSSGGDAGRVKGFVDQNLERRDYPTREQYMARLKITEQQRQYTTGFDVKHYLSIIPDPANHFSDPNRKCAYRTVAFEFLKSHFNKNRVSTISSMYTRSGYNITRAADSLILLNTEMKGRRGNSEMPTEDITLLQEMAFIKHRKEINNYIKELKRKDDEEFQMLKARNQLVQCECCYDSECILSKCSTCDNGHIFCNTCVVAGTSAKMGEDQTRIHCFVDCGSEFSLSVLQRVLAPTTFSILLKKRQAAEVIEAGLEGLVSCPFCHFASIPPEGDKIFKCLNPECTKESCRLCKELSHVPLKCDEVMKTDNARRYIEEKMTQALARKCYKCQRAFFKEEGCNKITCPCGAIMCYLCDEPIKDYKHFRGQGSQDTNLCPLYSDTIRLDAVAVRKVAEQAQQQLLKQHPNLRVDTSHLLPAIPRARSGPHQDVLNADELPRRAQRVLDLPPE